MTTPGDLDYLEPVGSLSPAPAAVALIVDERGRYLVQLRDDIPTIFFPNHWGCFGGALEPGETHLDALHRELHEELALDSAPLGAEEFTRFTFDFGFAGGGIIDRAFFEVPIKAAQVDEMVLGEGSELRLWEGPELLKQPVVPYDRFAIWMHCYRTQLALGQSPTP
ncbi:mutator protein [Candidatus Phaeomarinobacter ectocarpi]|uniref:Mutator protein n=1 Tax=Candidatus Phaeomarinibacter ectocarpi TaxID=1458461 RepID=X5MEP0_9HYPH|nr:NUDIX domain-containing protein [Candidatus Phaeomarinobacter ectocarpi]CDO59344.1 mutator protein [Candidatus Phaeomarinobacter ectocarpi]